MPNLSFEEKRSRVKELLAGDSALKNIVGMTKPNDAPTYDGEKMLEHSRRSVGVRGRKYASVAKDLAAGKKFTRQ